MNRTTGQLNRTDQPDNGSCIYCPVSGSYETPETIEAFRNLFEYLDSIRTGIMTPSGRPKKLPWYAIVHCPSCHAINMTGIKDPVSSRFRCKNVLIRRNVGMYSCDTPIEIIETHGEDIEKVLDKQAEWKEKYT